LLWPVSPLLFLLGKQPRRPRVVLGPWAPPAERDAAGIADNRTPKHSVITGFSLRFVGSTPGHIPTTRRPVRKSRDGDVGPHRVSAVSPRPSAASRWFPRHGSSAACSKSSRYRYTRRPCRQLSPVQRDRKHHADGRGHSRQGPTNPCPQCLASPLA
jgi:hypothetical protein